MVYLLLMVNIAFSGIVEPDLINKNEIKSFSFLFGSSYFKELNPVGTNFVLELQGTYSDNSLTSKDAINPAGLDSYYAPALFILRKGLYWNIDASISFLTPLNESVQNGFSFSLAHTIKYKKFSLKSSAYMFSYNINETLNQRGFGANSLIGFKATKTLLLFVGLGLESLNSKILYPNQASEDLTGIELRGLYSMALPFFKRHTVSLDASYRKAKNYQLGVSYSLRL